MTFSAPIELEQGQITCKRCLTIDNYRDYIQADCRERHQDVWAVVFFFAACVIAFAMRWYSGRKSTS